MIRRVIFPDDDAWLTDPARLLPGEAMLIVPLAGYDGTRPRDYLAAHFSKLGTAVLRTQQFPERVAQIDGTGKVVAVIAADPLIDSVAGHTLVQTDTAAAGWTFAAGVFTAPVKIV